MANIRFSAGDYDRRRRLMNSEGEAISDDQSIESADSDAGVSNGAAFQLLSRDRMIRRVISPRRWKCWVVIAVLIGTPLAIEIAKLAGPVSQKPSDAASTVEASQLASLLYGISGLELFFAAQLCLLICWVRAASALDFQGGFRTWRWMSILLTCFSILLVTGVSDQMMDIIAAMLKPVVGVIESARPALLLVPAGAAMAFVLRYLIPDMSRCRESQSLAILAIVGCVGRLLLGFRGPAENMTADLGVFTAIVAGLTVSSALLHCRYVIHVNPNPPIALQKQKPSIAGESAVGEENHKVDSKDARIPDVAKVDSTRLKEKQSISLVASSQIEPMSSEMSAESHIASDLENRGSDADDNAGDDETVQKADKNKKIDSKKSKPSKKQLRKAG